MEHTNEHFTRYSELMLRVSHFDIRRLKDGGYRAAMYILSYDEDVFALAKARVDRDGIHFTKLLQDAAKLPLYAAQDTMVKTAYNLFNGSNTGVTPLDIASCELLDLDILCNAFYIWKGLRKPVRGPGGEMVLQNKKEQGVRQIYQKLKEGAI